MLKSLIKKIACLLVFLSLGYFHAALGQEDTIFQILKTELDRNFSILKKEAVPAYYISAELTDNRSVSCVGRMGYLQSPVTEPFAARYLSTMLRVGSYELDNTHETKEVDGGNDCITAETVAQETNERILKTALWSQIDYLYKSAVLNYNQIKVDLALKKEQPEKLNDFSKENAEKYYEAPVTLANLNIDATSWENKVKKYSAVFNQNEDIFEGSAAFATEVERKYFVDTEGKEIAQNHVSITLALSANAIAEDGMGLSLNKIWTVHSFDELPSDEEVLREAENISKNLTALKKAPVVESFTGPAILSPDAAGVFFHEIFGHRIEGARMRQESDAQTFKKKIGEQVLPEHISVTFDPTIKYYQKMPLCGNYVYDDEGTKSRKVEVVKKGILSDFLMSRKPIEGISQSNGHGRAQTGGQPVSRQSNMIIESTHKYKEEDLRKMLVDEAKKQGKTYAYYFKEVSGGYTLTERYMPNAFNITPLMVYRIYVDGRPDELVRGVDLVGTPLSMFSQIEACGNTYAVFNGVCGAESGSVPVSCVSPALFVKRIETQKSVNDQIQLPLLPKP